DPSRSLRFDGENPYLNPNAALHIGLAMHELAVNSVSYGALSQPDGRIRVSARIAAGSETSPGLLLIWTERIGAGRRTENRFGSVALERVVPTSLNGSASLDIDDDRLEYRLTIPRGNFEIE
ncbi:MAG: sensor histidine kinase, partial [Mesorhizobium sp.]